MSRKIGFGANTKPKSEERKTNMMQLVVRLPWLLGESEERLFETRLAVHFKFALIKTLVKVSNVSLK